MNQNRSWSNDSGQSPSPVAPEPRGIGGGWGAARGGLALLLPQLLEQGPLLGGQGGDPVGDAQALTSSRAGSSERRSPGLAVTASIIR